MSNLYHWDDDRPHTDTHVCGKCRKEFKRGERILQAFIFERKGLNPQDLGNTGAHLFGEFEFVHVDCHDPLLKKGVQHV